jgi:hypothetical protein
MVTAVAGKPWSGVEVATTIASTSSAVAPAAARADRAAAAPMKAAVSWAAAIRRSAMPVRSRIHESDVSIRRASSALVSTRSGR